MAASRFLCHIMGVVSLIIAVILLVVGLVLEIVYQGEDGSEAVKVVAIVLFGVGALFCFITVFYVCRVTQKDWKLFGCCRIKTKFGETSTIRRDDNPTEKDSPRNSTMGGNLGTPSFFADSSLKGNHPKASMPNGGPPSAAELDFETGDSDELEFLN